MRMKTRSIAGTFVVLLLCFASFGQTNAKNQFSITLNSVGEIRIGMSVAKAIEAMPDAKFGHYDCQCAAGGDNIIVTQGDKELMTLNVAYWDDETIDSITARDSRFRLSNGVGPGNKIAALEGIYGKVRDIATTYDEETVEFTNHPKGLKFIVAGIGNNEAGNYPDLTGGDPREKHAETYTAGAYVWGIAVSGDSSDASSASYLLTPTSAGDIRLGMTITEARNIFKNVTLEQNDYGEEGVVVAVKRGEMILMSFMTDQKDKTGDANGVVPIVETARIESITFSDTRYKTADGVHIGMTIKDAEQRVGKLKKIDLWEYDGSEHAEFSNSPKTFAFTVSAKKGSPDDSRAGIYGKDKYSTTKYSEGAILETITISKSEN